MKKVYYYIDNIMLSCRTSGSIARAKEEQPFISWVVFKKPTRLIALLARAVSKSS